MTVPAVTPETRQLGVNALGKAQVVNGYREVTNGEAVDVVLSATVPAIEAAARKRTLDEAAKLIEFRYPGVGREFAAAIRSLMPTPEVN